ncbi:pilus assembly protein CpaE [Pedococcus cremeus]|uniref:Pilus assembly protein CpaE n=1 Tax=Pedococcus cremeus TaxID=587636 RepID=A0A1H9XC49_9MICO|nr:AAA family ATPase [Pedococcus cremeus]SES43766.1 pilus assembly protein CpaE [Pedococcus cremeus]
MTLLWDNDPAAAERFSYAVGGDITRQDSHAALIRSLEDSPGEHLVVIGPDIDMQSACDLSEAVRVQRAEVGVLLLRRRLDVAVLGQALRAGVREVITADDLTGLADAVRRSRELSLKMAGHQDHAVKEGKVVTVFSAKGGVGKTTFSTNLGAYLASTGAKVLVVDLDLAFGDVGISLQMLPQNSIIDLVQMAGHLDEKGLESVVTHHESGLDAACAPAEPSDADRIPGQIIGELLKVGKRKYDFIVVDTPPAFTEHVLAAFDNSDLLILLATLDIPAVKNLRLTLDTLDLLGSPKEDRVVVLNRSDAKVGLRAEDVVAVIKQEIAVMVPNSQAVPASVNRGVPIVLDEPKHAVSLAIKELAESFIKPLAASDGRDEPKERRGQDEHARRRILSWGGRR